MIFKTEGYFFFSRKEKELQIKLGTYRGVRVCVLPDGKRFEFTSMSESSVMAPGGRWNDTAFVGRGVTYHEDRGGLIPVSTLREIADQRIEEVKAEAEREHRKLTRNKKKTKPGKLRRVK